MLRLPHTALVYPVVSSTGMRTPTFGAPVTVRCQVTPEKAMAAMERFGVETQSPHLFLADSTADLEFGYRIEVLGKTWKVKAPPQRYQGIGYADHVTALIEEEG